MITCNQINAELTSCGNKLIKKLHFRKLNRFLTPTFIDIHNYIITFLQKTQNRNEIKEDREINTSCSFHRNLNAVKKYRNTHANTHF